MSLLNKTEVSILTNQCLNHHTGSSLITPPGVWKFEEPSRTRGGGLEELPIIFMVPQATCGFAESVKENRGHVGLVHYL